MLFANIASAQFRVEQITINGELTSDDPFEPKFGRFDPVELYLTKGDVISFSISADFPPFLALVAPSEKFYVKYAENGNSISNYLKTITESGTWFLSIAGDSSDFGKYSLRANYMSASSASLPGNADFCTSLKFLAEHSKINFFFMKKPNGDNGNRSWDSKINLTSSLNSAIIKKDINRTSYSALMYETDSKDSALIYFDNTVNNTQNCLGPEWLSNSKDWRRNKDGAMSKEEKFVIKDKEIKKYVTVILSEGNSESNKYKINIELYSEE